MTEPLFTEEEVSAMPGYGTWCWDCRTPALAEDYVTAIEEAKAAGWRLIRGVWRCEPCAEADDRTEAQRRQGRQPGTEVLGRC
jgi:hypothetical protein